MTTSVNITVNAKDQETAEQIVAVVNSMLQKLPESAFLKLAKKIKKNPDLFKGLVKYLPLI